MSCAVPACARRPCAFVPFPPVAGQLAPWAPSGIVSRLSSVSWIRSPGCTCKVGPKKPRCVDPSAPRAANVWVSATVTPLISTLPFLATSVVLSRPSRLRTTGGSSNAIPEANGAGGMTGGA